jgi:hypothetical protein
VLAASGPSSPHCHSVDLCPSPVRCRTSNTRSASKPTLCTSYAGKWRHSSRDGYTIADIASLPWITRHERQGQRLQDYPNFRRWYDLLIARPAVQKGLALMAERQLSAKLDDSSRSALFGDDQYRPR